MPNGCKDYFHFFPWILHVCPPPPPPPPSIGLYLSFCFPGPCCSVRGKEGLGSILVISTKINTSLLGVRFIDPAAWVDLSLARVGSVNKNGVGGSGWGIYFTWTAGAGSCVYTKSANNGQRNFVKNRKNVEWNSIYNGCHSNAKLLKIVRQSVLENILKNFIIFPIFAGIMETKSNKYL